MWILGDNGAEISIPMSQNKGTLAKPGREAPFLQPFLKSICISPLPPRKIGWLPIYYLLTYFFFLTEVCAFLHLAKNNSPLCLVFGQNMALTSKHTLVVRTLPSPFPFLLIKVWIPLSVLPLLSSQHFKQHKRYDKMKGSVHK